MKRYNTPTKDNIIKEATQLIFKNGFAGTSIDLILAKTGITKGAFFYHFKTKADLALALLNDFARYDAERLQQALNNTEEFSNSPKQRLLEFIQFFINLFEDLENPPGCLYASVSNEQNTYSDEVKQVVFDGFTEWRRVFKMLFDDILNEHQVNVPDLDADSLLSHFNAVLEGAFILSKALYDPKIPVKQLKHLKNYYNLLFQEKTVEVVR
ncbi:MULTISPECIES: TetR/AcrR family transcriptional regulator [Flavobacteriaceae]|uniref:TetR/AcrR family transcriptional regulator n=1 Tax=Flavobacteriaceae TaxID=49546 RepID=UPI0014925FDD|nr:MULTISPECIES: helix-turn-helix domain-containing protein [Allomuricauda]MDC6366199.1 helix-turn-helix domain containing protein [Muricauda sp. AC10]